MNDQTVTPLPEPTDPTRATPARPLMRRALAGVAGAALALTLAVGCGSTGESVGSSDPTTASGDPACTEVTDGVIEIVTTKFDFDPDCITMSGDRLKVTYDNAEEGIKHNIHFKDAKSSTGSAKTELKAGPDVQTVTLVDLEAGSYTFVCDIHPSMKGELTVTD